MRSFYAAAAATVPLLGLTLAQSSCTVSLEPSGTPVAADGYEVRVIANDLGRSRSLQRDTKGNTLVVKASQGIANVRFKDHGGTCLEVESKVDLTIDAPIKTRLNHGIALSPDGKTLYASTNETVYSWEYDAEKRNTRSGTPKVVITGLGNGGHSTRTLLYSKQAGGQLIAVRGSNGNIDLDCADISTGHCQMKAFGLRNIPKGGWEFTKHGQRLGWGMRNSVGISEHPGTKGIWTVENSVDMLKRDGKDIHQDNPGEELNFHGKIGAAAGANYGYPHCVSAWELDSIPNNEKLKVGSQFAHDIENNTKTDAFCAKAKPPRLVFPAHTAPLDIKFNGTEEAFVSLHGSWNRDTPIGYKLVKIPFKRGEPVSPSTDKEGTIDIVTNKDTTKCPGSCLRPVGITFDEQGRLYFVSDATGEIYVVRKK